MPTTSNFGWTTPADTDLVKDGAAAIRTLGNGIDTSFLDLKGGTTGQVLSKATNTDLDFTWTAPTTGDITEVQAGVGISISSGTGPIPVITNSSTDLITTAGDLLYGTAADTLARLGIGTAGQVLKVNSGATAPEWGSAASTESFSLLNAGGTATNTGTTVTVSSLSGYNTLAVYLQGISNSSASSQFLIRLNTDSTNKYSYVGQDWTHTPTITNAAANLDGTAQFYWADQGNNAANVVSGWVIINGANSTGPKIVEYISAGNGTGGIFRIHRGIYTGTSVVSSVSLVTGGGAFDAGTIYVYGAN